MTRAQALASIRDAGYHGDSRRALRLYVEHSRVGIQSYLQAYRAGESAKRSGAACTCPECSKLGVSRP